MSLHPKLRKASDESVELPPNSPGGLLSTPLSQGRCLSAHSGDDAGLLPESAAPGPPGTRPRRDRAGTSRWQLPQPPGTLGTLRPRLRPRVAAWADRTVWGRGGRGQAAPAEARDLPPPPPPGSPWPQRPHLCGLHFQPEDLRFFLEKKMLLLNSSYFVFFLLPSLLP